MRRALIDLHPDEDVLGFVRASVRSKIGAFIFTAFWVLLPCFFFFPLLGLGIFGLLFACVLVGSGLIRVYVLWRNWFGTVLIITDSRIVDIEKSGLFRQQRTEIEHQNLLDALVEPRNTIQAILGIGAVRIRTTKALSYEVVFYGLQNPQRVADLINDVQYMTAPSSSAQFHVAKKSKH